MSDIITISKEIKHKIKQLDNANKELKARGEAKAKAIIEYEKALSLTLIQLRNGESFTLDNEIVKDPPTTVMEKIAKGIVYKEKLDMEMAEISYKSLITGIESLKTQLNAYQSILKYLQ